MFKNQSLRVAPPVSIASASRALIFGRPYIPLSFMVRKSTPLPIITFFVLVIGTGMLEEVVDGEMVIDWGNLGVAWCGALLLLPMK